MNEITFPGLNLKLNISRVAFKIGNLSIYWYAILMVSAFLIALLIFKKKDGKFGIRFSDVLDICIILIPVTIIFARLYYVLFSLEYYISNPLQIFNLRNGGLAIYGGIIGGVLVCYIFCKKKKINILDLFDYMVPALALGQAIGRWGNFVNVEAYGRATTLPWRMGIMEGTKYIEVHPTFLYESIVTFAIFILLTVISNKRKFKGQITYLYLIIYSFARAIIETLRTDSLMIGNLRVSCILSILIFIFASFMYGKNILKNKEKNN